VGAPIVIVGASLAGLRAAQAIRRAEHDGDVIVVGAAAGRSPTTALFRGATSTWSGGWERSRRGWTRRATS
jgi:NADPH-dependent 2,4-dienoyl-CoA reductase/sulfur reductase-like enzyme